MPDYRRNRVPGGTTFFTGNLRDWNSRLLTDRIDLLRGAIRSVRSRRPFHIDGWVVLPDHMHCIWTLPPDDVDFSGRWYASMRLFEIHSGHRATVIHDAAARGTWHLAAPLLGTYYPRRQRLCEPH
jgi:REP element-mobilizing transposase RayT